MLTISRILGESVEAYFHAATKGGRDCRLLVPGLTEAISHEIHDYLLEHGVRSYLVVGQNEHPNQQKQFISPIGLTSKRIGSFVAVSNPGQLAHIQDSIRGSGGTIRSAAYSEEWPWIDNGSEAFRFDGPILDSLVNDWAKEQEQQIWLRQFVLKGLVGHTKSCSARSHLLLENIIGTFDPKAYPDIPDVREKMLYHAGVPRPRTFLEATNVIQGSARLCRRILDRCQRDEDAREQARSRVAEVMSEDNATAAVEEALDVFMDGLGRSLIGDAGLISFQNCWGNKSDPGYWRVLTADRLAELFEVKEREKVEVEYDVTSPRGLVSGDKTKVATFYGELINLDITYLIPEKEFSVGTWTVQVRNRQHTVAEQVLSRDGSSAQLQIDTSVAVTRHARKIPLKVALVQDEDVRADKRLELHLCGQERPAFAVVETQFEVIDATANEDEEVRDKKITLSDASHIYLFSDSEGSVSLLNEDEEEISLIGCEPGVWRSTDKADVEPEPSGQLTMICKFDGRSAVVCLEATDIDKGEFTVEDELRTLLVGADKKRLDDLAELFRGEKAEHYRHLGKIDDAARRRSVLARVLTTRTGWRPLLVDLLKNERYESDSLGSYVNCLGAIDEDALRTVNLPDVASDLLKEYSDARHAVIQAVRSVPSSEPPSEEHPIYASHPVFVRESASQRRDVLSRFLESYISILNYVIAKREELEWSQLLVLTYLDCVVHWDDTPLRNAFFLIGPWHPLVVAKRFMVQEALLSRADRIRSSGGEIFRKLSALLGEVQGFRWGLSLAAEDKSFEPARVAITSDPGWHLALKRTLLQPGIGGLHDALRETLGSLRQKWGLSTEPGFASGQPLAVTALKSYLQAYPSRRSVGMRIREGHSDISIIKSLDSYLHAESGPSEQGKQLPGGVRLYLESKLSEDVDATWSDPQICIFRFSSDETCVEEGRPDIYMLPPMQSDVFKTDPKRHCLPRGKGDDAVFSQPLRWLTEGQSLIPRSIAYEFDLPSDGGVGLGERFLTALGQLGTAFSGSLVSVSSIDLPQRLSAPWVVMPGRSIDPAILAQYVRDGADRELEERTLWDYKLDLTGSASSFFVLSTVPRGFQIAVNGFFQRENLASGLVAELGKIGIAIGGEALKSGRHALGVIGLVGAVRMLTGNAHEREAPLSRDASGAGFLLPVDSFSSFFGKNDPDDRRRTDLLAVRLALPRSDSEKLVVSACGIESKFVSGTFSAAQADAALEQGQATTQDFRSLVAASLEEGGMPERLALMELFKFGLRVTAPSGSGELANGLEIERVVFQAVLAGDYEFQYATHNAVVVSTEAALSGVAACEPRGGGLWIRLTKGHWPGVSDTEQLEKIRDTLCALFKGCHSSAATASLASPSEPSPCEKESSSAAKPTEQSDESDPAGMAAEANAPTQVVLESSKGALEGILVGVDESRRAVRFDPQSPIDPLDNMNVMVTGSSGTGKTQFLKYLICMLREQGKNLLILDLKNDFASDSVFCERASLDRVFVAFDGLPYNPLIPYPVVHPATGEPFIQCAQHIAGISSVLKRTYGLGVQQQAAAKNAIVDAFVSEGIGTTGSIPYTENLNFPDFSNVGVVLQTENPAAYNRLDPLFTLDLFREASRGESFHSLVKKAVVLDLSQIPSDEIKNALAQMIVLSAHSYFNAQPHSGSIRQFLVFDEGHRVLGSEYMLRLVRECRAYGVGVILSSQYPRDFPGEISASMATKVLHGNGRDMERVKDVIQILGCEGREGEVANLRRFQAFLDSRHYPHAQLRTMNYPLYLVWSKLREVGAASRDTLSTIDGIDPAKLPVANLIHQLELLGLAEEKDGLVQLLNQKAQ